jgi:hypothetical protein
VTALDTPTAVYRFFGADKGLLYVGVTDEPKRRFRKHAKAAVWWPDVAGRSIDWFDSRSDALVEEARAIREENPLHNKAGVPGRAPAPQTVRATNLAALNGHRVAGAHEIGLALCVTRQRVQQLMKRQDWPAPVCELAMGKLWSVESIRGWALANRP